MFFVYIAKSDKDGSFYVGCTTDLGRRILEHNAGKTQSLRSRRPLRIVYTEEYANAVEAYTREKQIKSYKSGAAFRKLISNGGVA